MIRLLHTSDWHLGKRLYDWPRLEEQQCFLTWLVDEVRHKVVDALLICGDIFDSSNPPAEAERLYYEFLARLHSASPSTQVIISSGNHDSALRLSAPRDILSALNTHIACFARTKSGERNYKELIVPLYKQGEQVATCIALPYLRQGDYDMTKSYEQGVSDLITELYSEAKKDNLPIFAMAHLFVMGGKFSSDKADLFPSIGLAERISADVFPKDIQYVALGHLHRPHSISPDERIRYSGSPMPFDFSEHTYTHGVTLVEMDDSALSVEALHFRSPAPLLTVRGSMQDIEAFMMQQPEQPIDASAPFLHIELESETVSPLEKVKIKQLCRNRYVRLAKATLRGNAATAPEHSPNESGKEQRMDPLEIASLEYRKKIGADMSQATQALFTEAVQKVLSEV